ncbi:MAG TPA: hypothetical protein VGB07_20520 [Blastocatellia bacterium]
MAFQRRLGELTTICLVWCLFGVYFYRAPERIGRTEENIEKTHNDQYSQQYLHMSRRCYELAKEVEGIPTIPTISFLSPDIQIQSQTRAIFVGDFPFGELRPEGRF